MPRRFWQPDPAGTAGVRLPKARSTAITAALAVTIAAATSGCRVDVSVGIDANDTGGGEITARAQLDGSAVTQLGGPEPGDRIRLDDLEKAGWDIEGPTKLDDGGLEIVATHDFDTPGEAEGLVADLGGDPGPLKQFTLRQTRTFLKTTTDFKGTVDLERGLGAFTDPSLQEALGATAEAPLGVTPDALEKRLGAALDRLLGLQVAVHLPGDVESNAPTATKSSAVWAPAIGEQQALEATSQQWNVGNIAGAATSTLSALGLAAVLIIRRRNLTVTDGNITVDDDGETREDRTGTPGA